MRAKSGFTLVEILIVVVILGILAAIVIPQFTEASTEAKVSRVASDLQMLRSQVELYKVQHNDSVPTSTADFDTALTTQDANGYGPYMQQVPTNPFASSDSNKITIGDTACSFDGSSGWYYDGNSVYANTDEEGEEEF